jgi:hypothetical protein
MEKNKIEYIIKRNIKYVPYEGDEIDTYQLAEDFKEYVKYHIDMALKAASENVKLLIDKPIDKELLDKVMAGDTVKIALVDKNSILNAYPESNIK